MKPLLSCALALVCWACAEGSRPTEALPPPDSPGAGCVAAEEMCNGQDDDCDLLIDEEMTRACGEGESACADQQQRCVDGDWTDCTDTAPAVETCNDRDDDCDGMVDEGLTRACGTALGICEAGRERCVGGAWADCDATGPAGDADEICDGMLDDDCDGTVDEGCACTAAERRPCGQDAGRCQSGEQVCVNAEWSSCEGAVQPSAERCDGTDDDCDGMIDEQIFRDCGTDEGLCETGMQMCQLGVWSDCIDAVDPNPETCDGRDEDCDGRIDEALTQTCGIDIGICQQGEMHCNAGEWSACMDAAEPGAERCEGSTDEDCDGTVDEGCQCIDGRTRPCGSDAGACAPGTQTCRGGAWAACVGATDPRPEVCDGIVDENCDGTVDEGCMCINGRQRPCGQSVGACRAGTETCANGRWGLCVGGQNPRAERCGQGQDEDCDGSVDEGFRARYDDAPYSTLNRSHELCTQAARFSDHCMSAYHRRCNADCTRSGFGPVENNGDNALGVCTAGIGIETDFGTLARYNGGCRADRAFNQACNDAIDQYCRAEGHGSGFGPVEHVGNVAFVVCVPRDVVQRFTVTWADLARRHEPCNGQFESFGPNCAAATHRECQARGFFSGWGPLQIQGQQVGIMCLRR